MTSSSPGFSSSEPRTADTPSETLRTHAARDGSMPRNPAARSRAVASSPPISTRLKRCGLRSARSRQAAAARRTTTGATPNAPWLRWRTSGSRPKASSRAESTEPILSGFAVAGRRHQTQLLHQRTQADLDRGSAARPAQLTAGGNQNEVRAAGPAAGGMAEGTVLRSGADVGREVLAGKGGAGGDEVGGCALEDDQAAVMAGPGAEVNDPVGVRHDRLVVLDDDDRFAGVNEPVEQAKQLLDVGEVEAGGRLVEDVDAALLAHVGGQLEPLPLAAGQRRERLAEAEVAEPDVGEPAEDGVRGRGTRLTVAEELPRLGHRHREHLADVAAGEVVLQHRCVEPLPLAHVAGGNDAGHHRQVGVDDAGAVAVGTGALGVGAEQRRLHAVGLRERIADRVEQPGVGRRVAPSRAAGRGLVDRHHTRAGGDRPAYERALAGAGDTGDDDKYSERDVDVDVAQVVRGRAADLQRAGGRPHRLLEGGPVGEVAAGDGVAGLQLLDGALEADGAARRASTGAEVDDVVRDLDRLRLVLYDEHRVALVPQPQQQVVHPLDVVGVQARGGLVEDVGDVSER